MTCLCLTSESALDHVSTEDLDNGHRLDSHYCDRCDTWFYVEFDPNSTDPETGDAVTVKTWHQYPSSYHEWIENH